MKTVFVIKRMYFNLFIIPIRISLSTNLGFVNMSHISDSRMDSRLGRRSPQWSKIEIFDHILVKFGPSCNNRQITLWWDELLIRFVVFLNVFWIFSWRLLSSLKWNSPNPRKIPLPWGFSNWCWLETLECSTSIKSRQEVAQQILKHQLWNPSPFIFRDAYEV